MGRWSFAFRYQVFYEESYMNRTVLFGVVIFFAVVAIALMGSGNQAIAGHGCHGCGGSYGYACGGYACGGYACGGYACDGCFGCGGVAYRARACGGCYAPCGGCAGVVRRHQGLFHHRRAMACYGVAAPCCGPVVYGCGCGGMVVPTMGAPLQKAPVQQAPVQKVEIQKAPVQETSVIAPTASLYPSRITYSRVVFRR